MDVVWVAAAAKCGSEDGHHMIGSSAIVAPTGEDFANQVTFDFFDHSPNQQVREERLKLIREQIEAEGEMTVGRMECDPAYATTNGPDARRDFARVRGTGAQS